MSRISCSFCTNPNPLEAKFCNQCGSPLGLKPCSACEAVNDAAAERCHQCGAAFEAPAAAGVADTAEPAIAPESKLADAGPAPFDSGESIAPRESNAADESIAAAPIAGSPEPDPPAHIPESLADRLERDGGVHAGERIEPRIARLEERDTHGADVSASIPWTTRMPRRSHPWRAPLLLALIIAVAATGYSVYKGDAPDLNRLFAFAERHADEPASADSRSRESRAAAPASDAPAAEVPPKDAQPVAAAASTAPSAKAGTDAQPATNADPASAALVSVQPGAPGQPQDAASAQPAGRSTKPKAGPSAAPSGNDDEAARQKTDPAGRSRRQADADAIATQRLIARDLGTATASPASAPANPLDRDAAETQRLIERDLGPFLHRNDRSSTGGPYPATD